MTVAVRVSKRGPTGAPHAEVTVDPKISAKQLAAVVQAVTTSTPVLKAAGLRVCGGCKSGLDINILGEQGQVVNVEIAG